MARTSAPPIDLIDAYNPDGYSNLLIDLDAIPEIDLDEEGDRISVKQRPDRFEQE